MLELLTYSSFAKHLNEKFQVLFESGETIYLDLVEASQKNLKQMDCFSLIFRSNPDTFLQQDNYRLYHQTLGEFVLLLVPVSKDQDGFFYYESFFARLI